MSSLGRSRAAQIKKKKRSPQQPNRKLSLEELIEQGENYASEFKLDLALKSFNSALSLDPQNTYLLDTIGELWLEQGELERAKQYFIKSIQCNPEDNASKYMNLGQLTGGQDGIKCYTKGIEIMEKELAKVIQQENQENQLNNNTNNNNKQVPSAVPTKVVNQNNNENNKNKKTKDGRLVEDQKIDEEELSEDEEDEEEPPYSVILKDHICSALCSLAELYLTDECFDDNAEVECEKNLLKAIDYAPNSPEPYSLLASMKISQKKNQEALQCLQHSYSLWSEMTVDERPSLEFRYGIAQMFVELSYYRSAVDILETLVYEQDNIAELWHTLGVVYDKLNEPRSALDCLENAVDLLKIAHDVDEEMSVQIKQLLVKVQHDVSLLPPEEDEDEDEDERMEE